MKTLYEAVLEIRTAVENNAAPVNVRAALREISYGDGMTTLHPDLLIDLFDALDAFVDTESGSLVQRLLESGDHTTRSIRHDAARVVEAQSALAQASQHCRCPACEAGTIHASDCAVHNEPAEPRGPCDCGALEQIQAH